MKQTRIPSGQTPAYRLSLWLRQPRWPHHGERYEAPPGGQLRVLPGALSRTHAPAVGMSAVRIRSASLSGLMSTDGWKDERMLSERFVADYLQGLEALSGVYPDESDVITSHGVVVALDDDDAFVILLRLVGPAAPPFADELWQLISTFLNNRRAEELFGGPEDVGRTHLNTVRRPRYIPPATRPVIPR